MRRSILLTALALGAQAAWAQDTTDPMLPDTGSVVVEETETGETVDAGTDGGTGEVVEATDDTEVVDDAVDTEVVDDADDTEVVDDADDTEVVDDADDTEVVDDTDDTEVVDETGDTDVVEDDADEDTGVVEDVDGGSDVVEDTDEDTDEADDDTDEDAEVRTDNRSATGAFRGGHRGSVSTLARAGLGPVFGKLRSQGYGDIDIEQADGMIHVSGARRGEVRHLVYDAATGALVSDVSEPSGGILETLSAKVRQDAQKHGKSARDAAPRETGGKSAKDRGGKGAKDRSGKGGGKEHGGKGGGKDRSGKGGSKGGGHGKSGGRNK